MGNRSALEMKNTDGGNINNSIEEFGRGYIGCRTCKCLPEEDKYLGSYHDETFNPSHKIILEDKKLLDFIMQKKSLVRIIHSIKNNIHKKQEIKYLKQVKKIRVGLIEEEPIKEKIIQIMEK